MSKHTPGPWTVYEDEEEPTLVVQYEVTPSYYMPIWDRCFSLKSISDIDRANARLIAAAPDMLEALEMTRAAAAFDAIDCIEAAIAKAKGDR